MNPIQIAIIAFVVIVILLTLGYYWYDDARFKKKVENNFNQSTKDILVEDNKPTILDGIDASKESPDKFMQKDFAALEALDTVQNSEEHKIEEPAIPVPEDSVEAFFVKFDKIDFPYINQVNKDLDLVVDIVFEEPKKLKILPEITQFTHKPFVFYILEKDNNWQTFEKGKKYFVKAIKLVVQIIDKEGIISQAQIANIYQELHKFVINNDAHIRCSDYEQNISNIQEQIKQLNNIELILDLFFLLKEKQPFTLLAKFFKENGGFENNGTFDFMEKNNVLFSIANENLSALDNKGEYNKLAIMAKLHTYEKPIYVLDKIFDLGERFMQTFESRILTANKQVVGQREYDQLYSFVKNYSDSAEKKKIKLGSELIKRIF